MAALVAFGSLLAACGGANVSSTPPQNQQQSTLLASPSTLSVNLLSGSPELFAIGVSGPNGFSSGLKWSATDLSFLSVSLQRNSATSETVNVLLIGAGTSTIALRSSDGAAVSIPVTSIPCGRPDIVNYARLISPVNGTRNVPINTSNYHVEVGGPPITMQSPFSPSLYAHFVVNKVSTIDPQATLRAATPPPNAVAPSPAPPVNDSLGYQIGEMPQLAAGNVYTVYVLR